DGTDFHGWARQGGVRTVQGVLEEALGRLLGRPPRLSVAGRTDAGVHASGQVASFVADAVDPPRVQRALNAMLAPEVVVRRAARAADGFDARHDAIAREYVYTLNTASVPDPFTARFEWHRPGSLPVGPMRRAARDLLGQHDFASFCRAPQDGGTVRRLHRLSVSARGDRLDIRAEANAFVHQMVRSLVGTLVAVGEGRIDPTSMPAIVEARDRSAAGAVAPPHGLTLVRVRYGRRA
ncbi:MAG: tRNA pseudouridine(38-40) synthase TruA, partial [Actinomycetota bacterium]